MEPVGAQKGRSEELKFSVVGDYEEDDGSGEKHAFLKEGKDLSQIQSARRPPAPAIDPKKDDFIFMQIDTDYYTAIPPSK